MQLCVFAEVQFAINSDTCAAYNYKTAGLLGARLVGHTLNYDFPIQYTCCVLRIAI